MNVHLKITGGTIIDPERGIHAQGDLLVCESAIVGAAQGEEVEAQTTIDARGCLVLPGLIDFHAHLYGGGTESGIHADSALLPMGVTTGVDAGSCGSANYESFVQTVAATSHARIFSFINVSPEGLIVTRYPEELNPQYYDEPRITEIFHRYQGQCLGLKIRLSKEIVGNLGARPLERTLQIAERLGCSVTVHTTNPPIPPDEIAGMLRPHDIYCHMYQGTGDTIIGGDGKVRPKLYDARRRGVVFDTANGRKNFCFRVAKTALNQGFLPNIISSDVTRNTLFSDFVFSLPFTMMKFLKLGMSIEEGVAACTSAPARQIGMQGKLGTLAPGAFADVAIFRREKKQPRVVRDDAGDSITVDDWLIPQMTILGGKIAYRQIDFQ
ncbi:MAG: metallo-dependent hydrolase [Candidatus Acidiferrales bacterium]|jgi:predicted amidohydrolase